MNRMILMFALVISAPALSQQMYKCSDESGVVKFQQMPCSPTGGGEAITVNAPKSTGDGGLRESERAYMQASSDRLEKQRQADEAENQRQEALRVERAKARAAEDQARATWYMGNAIMMRR